MPLVQAASARRTIVFMTDFGTANDSVAICKAVIAGIAVLTPRMRNIFRARASIEEGQDCGRGDPGRWWWLRPDAYRPAHTGSEH